MRLYGASARNLWPRIVASIAVAMVAAQSVGLWWTLGWLGIIWIGLLVGLHLVTKAEQAAEPAAQARLGMLVSINTTVSTILQAAILAAIWATGDSLAHAFAVIAAFVGAAYVLLQYYSDLKRFRLLLAPYIATYLYIAYDLAAQAGWRAGAVV